MDYSPLKIQFTGMREITGEGRDANKGRVFSHAHRHQVKEKVGNQGKIVLRPNSTRKSRLPMRTLAHLQQQFQDLFRVTAQQAGRESGFIQRERKLTGETFVAGLVWGWMANPDASVGELSQGLALCGVQISPQGLDQRMTAKAACLQQVLEASLGLVVGGAVGSTSFLQAFTGVYLLDSTDVPVPDEWAAIWSGGGNQHRQRGALKVQTLWDYQGGGLQFSLHPARCHDAALPVAPLPAGALRVTDSAYFDAADLQALAEQGCFYLTRVPAKVGVQTATGQLQPLSAFLRQHACPDFEGEVCLTAHGLRCRLLAQRVPQAVVSQRQAHLRRAAKRKGKPVSQAALALAAWTLVATNLPAARLSFDQAFMVLRLRWQIELLFKLWKQHTHLETSRSRQPHRLMCEVYAKLLGLVIQHAVLLATCWDVPNQSLVKLAQSVQKSTFLLAYAIWTDPPHFEAIFRFLRFVLRSGCRLDTRKTHPSHVQRLLSLS